jgi:hypothetical protein
MPLLTVEIDTGSSSSRGRPLGEPGSYSSGTAQHGVIIATGLSRTTAEHLAEQITSLLAKTRMAGP